MCKEEDVNEEEGWMINWQTTLRKDYDDDYEDSDNMMIT